MHLIFRNCVYFQVITSFYKVNLSIGLIFLALDLKLFLHLFFSYYCVKIRTIK